MKKSLQNLTKYVKEALALSKRWAAAPPYPIPRTDVRIDPSKTGGLTVYRRCCNLSCLYCTTSRNET